MFTATYASYQVATRYLAARKGGATVRQAIMHSGNPALLAQHFNYVARATTTSPVQAGALVRMAQIANSMVLPC